jgi:hypothetical protein
VQLCEWEVEWVLGVVRVCSLPRWERSSLAGGALEFGTVQALAGTGESTVQVLVGEQAVPMVGGIQTLRTSRRSPCGHGHWFREEQRTEAGTCVLAGSCSGRSAVARQELEDTHAIGIVQEVAAWAAVEAGVAAVVVACK